jgi:SAM-dependent methyltransferase
MARWVRSGRTLEIGGGTGGLSSFLPDVILTDIQFSTDIDLVADAQALPFKREAFDTIVMFDVLHHIEAPIRFLKCADETLKPGGRIVVVEPYLSPVSRFFYRHFHSEPFDESADPLDEPEHDPLRDPYHANQAIPTLLFGRDRRRLEQVLPALRVEHLERLSFIAFPLSGGYRPWSLIPESLIAPVLTLENFLAPALAPIMAFRMLGVIRKH